MSKIYKGLQIMEMISKGQIADRTRFNFENNNFDGIVEYNNGTLYWIIFDEKWNEKSKSNLFEVFNIESTMVAEFELIEENTIDIDSITENKWLTSSDRNFKINQLIKAVKQLNRELREVKEK